MTTMFQSVQKRSVGQLRGGPSAFQKAAAGSLDLVGRLELRAKLDGHAGCVNTVCFSDDGEILISGSDDQRVMLWNWYTGARLMAYRSGHNNNIFQARPLPHTNNSTIVTCAADGQVRIGFLGSDGANIVTKLLAHHGSRAHKIALDPEAASCFYSCGEDGRVFHYDVRCPNARQSLLVCNQDNSDCRRERLQLHSIHCNPIRPWQFAVAGSDIFVRVYDQRRSLSPTVASPWTELSPAASLAEPVRKLAPNGLRRVARRTRRGEMAWHITCANFSRQGEVLATYNDESIYLFKSEGPMPAPPPRLQPRAASGSSIRKRRRRNRDPPEELASLLSLPSGWGTHGNATGEEAEARIAELYSEATAQANGRPQASPLEDMPSASPSGPPQTRAEGELMGAGTSIAESLQVPARAQRPDDVPATLSPQACTGIGDGSNESWDPSVPREAGAEELQAGVGSQQPPNAAVAGEDSGGVPGGEDDQEDESQMQSEGVDLYGDQVDNTDDFEEEEEEDSESSVEESASDMSSPSEGHYDEISYEEDMAALLRSSDSDSGAGISQEDSWQDFDDEVLMKYSGHRNCRTVKGVSFLGESDEYVMSGSDDGHVYIWSKADGILRQWLKGDLHVVNCLEPHPTLPLSFATSGIEDDIKLWTPTAEKVRFVAPTAARVIQRNCISQRPHSGRPSAAARHILLRLRRLAQGEEEDLQSSEEGDEDLDAAVNGGCVLS